MTRPPEFEFIAGHPALDFTNTLRGRLLADCRDDLWAYGRLREWAGQAGLLSPSEDRRLRQLAAQDPAGAASVLDRAVRLREALYAVISALVAGGRGGPAPPPSSLEVVIAEVAQATAQRRLGWAEGAGRMVWAWDHSGLCLPVWTVALSAMRLVTSDDLRRVHECAAPGCSWLFADGTRNHSRRWCDAAACGNRERVRRHYRRRRAAGAAAG